MMPIPSRNTLLYLEKSSSEGSGVVDQSTGGPVAVHESITAGSLKWYAPAQRLQTPDTHSKKTLIYHDSFWSFYTRDYQNYIFRHLRVKSEHGFTVYCINEDGDFVLLKHLNEYTEMIKPIDPSWFEAKLIELKLPRHQVSLLDHVTVRVLMSEEASRCLAHMADPEIFTREHQESSFTRLVQDPRIRGVYCRSQASYALIQRVCPSMDILALKIDQDNFICDILWRLIHNLEILEIRGSPTMGFNVLEFITSFSQLRFLEFKSCIGFAELSDRHARLSLKHLEFLRVIDCDKSSNGALVFLLAEASNIKYIYFVNCDLEGLSERMQSCSAPYSNQELKLGIINGVLSKGDLLTLINQYPQIASIELMGVEMVETFNILPTINRHLERLTELCILDCRAKDLSILALIQSAPNLEYLRVQTVRLSEITGDGLSQVWLGADWRRLTEVVLEYDGALDLLAFMASVPNITKLSIGVLEIVINPVLLNAQLSWGGLSYLRNSHFQSLPGSVLLKLLAGTPNLQRLIDESFYPKNTLTAAQILALPHGALKQLKFLQIVHGGNFPDEVLREIQRIAPELEINKRKATRYANLLDPAAEPSFLSTLRGAARGVVGLMLGKLPPPALSKVFSKDTNPNMQTDKARKQVFPVGNAPDVQNSQCRQEVLVWEDAVFTDTEIRFDTVKIPSTAAAVRLPICDSLEEMSARIQARFDPECHYYEVPWFEVREGEQPLLTISASDKIVAVLRPAAFCEFYYDAQRNQYYVTSSQACTLRYVLAVPKAIPAEASLPVAVKEIYEKYRKFVKRALVLPDNPTPDNIIKAMREQKVGSCEQRSLACFQELQKAGIEARMLRNVVGIHAYLEVCLAEVWIPVDLGGYPSNHKGSCRPPIDRLTLTAPTATELRPRVPSISQPGDVSSAQALPPRVPSIPQPGDVSSAQALPRVPSELPAAAWFERVRLSADVKQYWTFTSNETTHLAGAYLVQRYQQIKQRVFFVNQAEQLRCLINTLILTWPDQGKLEKSPSGAFKAFLCSEGARILIIDWNAFKPEEIAVCLGLLDGNFNGEDRYETLGIPRGLRVLSLQNIERQSAYVSQDFLTRHAPAMPCTITDSEFRSAFAASPALENPSVFEIDLYHSNQWERYLCGSWSLREAGFHFEPTAFFKALHARDACHLKLINPPVGDPGFDRMRLFLEVQRNFSYLGLDFKNVQVAIDYIPAPAALWERRARQIRPATSTADRPSWVLNPTSLHGFLGCESVSGDGNLVSEPGILEQNRKQVLGIIVSHDLGSSDWARLLDAATLHSVSLNVSLANGVSLPSELESLDVKFSQLPAQDSTQVFSSHPIVIQTDNINESVFKYIRHCRRGYDNPASILRQSITGCLPTDVFYQIGARTFDIESGRFSDCYLEGGPVLDALLTGKEVILTGSLSPEMQEFLAPLLTMQKPYLFFNNKRHEVTGRLVLITHTSVRCCPFVEIEHSPYTKAIDPLLLRSQAHEVPAIPTQEELEKADIIAERLYQQRETALRDACRKAAFVTIVGSTASGKTTFMQDFKRQIESEGGSRRIYWGTQELQAFLRENDRDSILFLDEFTLLDPKLIEQFSDLSQNPPRIWMDRRRYDIKGKVVVATNAQDYGNRQGVAVCNKSKVICFEPLPLAVLYAKSIKPILSRAGLSEKIQKNIGRHFLALYAHCLAYDRRKVSISARELEFMVLSFVACYAENHAEPENLAKQIAYNIASTLVPKEYLNVKVFKPKTLHQIPLPSEPVQLSEGEPFIFLREHQEAWDVLNYLLKAQAFNQAHGLSVAGINHLSLMGDSNIGKSAFLRAACIALEQQERMEYLPASALLETQRAMLSSAAQQGKILIHDEINTAHSTKLEKERNAYLGGVDLEGKPLRSDPGAPSFLYLSTKNPPGKTFAGRIEETLAESRRMIQLVMPAELSPQSVAQLAKSLSEKQRQQPRLQALLTHAEQHLKERNVVSIETVKGFYRQCQGPSFFQAPPGGHARQVMEARTMAELIARLYKHYRPDGTNPSTETIKKFHL